MSPDDLPGSDVVLHVGYHKSGSTYLQHLFRKSPVDDLTLKWGPGNLAWKVGVEESFSPDKWRNDIDEALGKREHPVAVISEEALSGHTHGYRSPQRWESLSYDPLRIAERLHATYPGARVLITIRRQVDYIISIYAYRVAVKAWETADLTGFVEREWPKGLSEKLRYDTLVSRYIELFSPDRVLVLPVEMLSREPDVFNARVLSLVGLEGETPPEVGRLNESTKLRAVLSFWRPVNHLFLWQIHALKAMRIPPQARARFSRFWLRLLKSRGTRVLNRLMTGGAKIEMDASWRNRIENHCRASNARTKELTGLPLEKWGYPLPENE